MYHYLLSFFLYHPSSFYVVFVTFDANCHSQKRQFFILALCTSILHRFLFFKFCQNKAMLQCNGPHGLRKDDGAHWTYQLQILSELCFQRVAICGNYEIVTISTDKNTFLMALIIKLILGNIFIKVKNPPGGATVTK